MRIFINEQPVDVGENTTLKEAIETHYPKLIAQFVAGGYLTDGTGREISADSKVEEGLIVRAVVGGRDSGNKE